MRSLRFYGTLYLMALKSRMEYRVDFALGVFTAALMQLAALSFYWVVFSRAEAIGGWSPSHVLFLFGVTAAALGLSELLANGIWWLPQYLVSGELDRLLLYPVRSLLFVLLSRPELHALGNLCSGLLMVAVSFRLAPPPLFAYALVPLWVVSGALIYTSLLVLIGCAGFRAVGPYANQYMIVHHLLNASRYPLTIYPRWLGFIMLFVCPLGAATFVPGNWLRGGGSLWLAVGAPIVAAGSTVTLAGFLWERSLRDYQSTGS